MVLDKKTKLSELKIKDTKMKEGKGLKVKGQRTIERGLSVFAIIYTVFFSLVSELSFGYMQHLCCSCHVAMGIFQGIYDRFHFQIGNGLF